MSIKQLEPTEVIRDECGTWIHPEFQQYMKDHFNNAEWVSQEQWDEMQRYFNIETTKIYMESSVSFDDWESMMDSCDISKWEPITPHGFFLIDIYFNEDDAEAIFAREIRQESEMPA